MCVLVRKGKLRVAAAAVTLRKIRVLFSRRGKKSREMTPALLKAMAISSSSLRVVY